MQTLLVGQAPPQSTPPPPTSPPGEQGTAPPPRWTFTAVLEAQRSTALGTFAGELKNAGYPGFSAPESRDTRDSGPNRSPEPDLPGIPRLWKSAGADRAGIFNDPAPIGALGAIALVVDCECHRGPGLIPFAPPQDSRSASHPLFLVQSEVPTCVSTRTALMRVRGGGEHPPTALFLRGGGYGRGSGRGGGRGGGVHGGVRSRDCDVVAVGEAAIPFARN